MENLLRLINLIENQVEPSVCVQSKNANKDKGTEKMLCQQCDDLENQSQSNCGRESWKSEMQQIILKELLSLLSKIYSVYKSSIKMKMDLQALTKTNC